MPTLFGAYSGAAAPYDVAETVAAQRIATAVELYGRQPTITTDFRPFSDADGWNELTASTWNMIGWKNQPVLLEYAVPAFPKPGGFNLTDAAAGTYNSYWTTFGTKLVEQGLGNIIIRWGWEFTGGWFPWGASGKTAEYVAAFQHFVTTMRAVPGSNFKFAWVGVVGYCNFDPATAYPGDIYVDYIGADCYDHFYAGTTNNLSTLSEAQKQTQREAGWLVCLNGQGTGTARTYGLTWWRDFAINHGKPLCLPEWGVGIRPDGTGGGDSAYFIQKMYEFINDPRNNVGYHLYFNFSSASADDHRLTGVTSFPQSRDRFKVLFGRQAQQVSVKPVETLSTMETGSAQLGTTAYTWDYLNTLFVSPSGNDTTGNGKLRTPYKTLEKAVTASTSGGTIVMRGGTYTDIGRDTQTGAITYGLVIDKSLTIQSYPTEVVWWDGSVLETNWTAAGSTWNAPYNRLFDRSPTNTRGAEDNGPVDWKWVNVDRPTAPWPDLVFIDGVQQAQVTQLADVTPGKFFVEGAATGTGKWFQATKIHIGTNPDGKEVRVSSKVKCVTFTADNCTIRGIGVRRYSNSCPDSGAVRFQGAFSGLENCILEDFSDGAATWSGGATGTAHHGFATRVSINRPGNLGLHIYRGDYWFGTRCNVTYANYAGYNITPQSGVLKTTCSWGVRLDRSYASDSISKGFWTDMSVDGAIVSNCVFERIGSDPICFETGANGIIANVLIRDCLAQGIEICDNDRVEIYNVTVTNTGGTNTGRGIHWYIDSRTPVNTPENKDVRYGEAYYLIPENAWQVRSLTMKNCVIVDMKPGSEALIAVDDTRRTTGAARAWADYIKNINNNVYGTRTATPSTWFSSVTQNTSGLSTKYQTLAAMKSGAGIDTDSYHVVDVDVLDASSKIINTTYHAGAAPLPAHIAALVGVPAGFQYMGALV